MISRTSAERDPLTLDSSGGAALFGPCGNGDQGRRLVLEAPGLRALDLHDDSLLEVLDLRGCGGQHHLHLQLDRLPQLRELHLPTLTAGAVIHLFQPALPRTLRIQGRRVRNRCQLAAGHPAFGPSDGRLAGCPTARP